MPKEKKPRKEPFGRPTKYDPKYCQELLEFFDRPPYEVKTKKIITKKGDVMEIEYEAPSDLPTMEGFARKIGVDRATLFRWEQEYPDFCNTATRARAMQYDILVTNGLKGHYEKTVTVFVAKNLTDLKDKKEVDITSGGDKIGVGAMKQDEFDRMLEEYSHGRDTKKSGS